jgi:hypothetical protein
MDWYRRIHLGSCLCSGKVSRAFPKLYVRSFSQTDNLLPFYSVIPSMGDFLSIMSAAFDSFYGFIYWSVAYWRMNRRTLWAGPIKSITTIINGLILLLGFFMLGPGLYTSIQAIIDD